MPTKIRTKTKSKSQLFGSFSSVAIPALPKFVTKDKFVTGGSVRIFVIWQDFSNWFLAKVEKPTSKGKLHYGDLRQDSRDAPIITSFGGKKKVETKLAQIFRLLEQQPKGEDGVLLTNGNANIFYVRDINNVLRAVSVYWFVGGWYVFAVPVGSPRAWRAGSRFFSRNSGN